MNKTGMRTAFVASTLPARFLYDNLAALEIGRIICGSKSLCLSYQFLREISETIEIVPVSVNRFEKKSFLKSEILASHLDIIIFHECCWIDLDLAILELQPKVEYFPSVYLDGWKKLEQHDLDISPLLTRIFKERTRSSLRLFLQAVKHKKNFDFYEYVGDEGIDYKSYVTSLKETSVRHLSKSCKCLESRSIDTPTEKQNNRNTTEKNIVFIVGKEIVEDLWQFNTFKKIAQLCAKYGYGVLIKDHPNPKARLNMEGIGKPLSPYTPFEVIQDPYSFKIGLFSTALVYQAATSISIADLIQPAPEGFADRKKHLLALPGGNKIKFISNIDDLEIILKESQGPT